GRAPVLGEERGRRHHLARLAVAALRHVEPLPRRLHRLRLARGKALDRRDVAALLQRRQRRLARAHRLALDVDGARAAQREPAAVLGAGKVEIVAQDPQERGIARYVLADIDAVLVDEKGGHGALPAAGMTIAGFYAARGCKAVRRR